MNISKQSLFILLGIIIILVVGIIMSLHSTHLYAEKKEKMLEEMVYDSNYLGMSLQKNLVDLVASYAINEYDKLISNSMQHRDVFAIIVDDYNLGEIMGEKSYVSGHIRDVNWAIIEYSYDNNLHNQQLEQSYYSKQYEIIGVSGKQLGMVTIYTSDDYMNEELDSIIIDNIHSGLLISFVLIFSLFITIHFFILKPLSNIIRTLKRSDENGLPIDKVPNDGSLEILSLSNSINNMVSSIRSSNIKLSEQHHELLEQKGVLNHQASHDLLTGLANRYLFGDRLQQGIEKSKRDGSTIALLFIDLDHFKEINDSYGHKMGDNLLKEVARKLSEIIRKEDTLARFGGDEFTVIIEGLKQGGDASLLANKIVTLLSEPITLSGTTFYVGCSIGISFFPHNGDLSEDLIKCADAAMYKAKEEGRNNFQYYNAEMTRLALERVEMETNLRTALINREFEVYYQPQINGKTNKLIGMEALVRWKSPILGLVLPDKFIPLAESTGLIVELDRFVMNSAMRQFSQWYKAGLNPGVLAMNLSIRQLQKKDFISVLKSLIIKTECKPAWLELEVTEGQIMTHPDEAIEILNEINRIGIVLAIDDFGTGYSSLSYLKKLPINKLKIDQSFVQGLPHDEEDAVITKTVIALAKSLNLNILAEGVETEAQKEFLLENGCLNIQGYYYSKPITANEMGKFMTDRRQLPL